MAVRGSTTARNEHERCKQGQGESSVAFLHGHFFRDPPAKSLGLPLNMAAPRHQVFYTDQKRRGKNMNARALSGTNMCQKVTPLLFASLCLVWILPGQPTRGVLWI
jgi:hypothetical protein